MIASLRRRHRGMTLALAVVAPAAFVTAIAVRPEPTRQAELPAPLVRAAPATASSTVVLESDALWQGRSLHTRVLTAGDRYQLELAADEPLRAPDVLVYASAATTEDAVLPPDARLLGRLGDGTPRVLMLGHAIPERLWLFSLAHGEVLAHADLGGAAR